MQASAFGLSKQQRWEFISSQFHHKGKLFVIPSPAPLFSLAFLLPRVPAVSAPLLGQGSFSLGCFRQQSPSCPGLESLTLPVSAV